MAESTRFHCQGRFDATKPTKQGVAPSTYRSISSFHGFNQLGLLTWGANMEDKKWFGIALTRQKAITALDAAAQHYDHSKRAKTISDAAADDAAAAINALDALHGALPKDVAAFRNALQNGLRQSSTRKETADTDNTNLEARRKKNIEILMARLATAQEIAAWKLSGVPVCPFVDRVHV